MAMTAVSPVAGASNVAAKIGAVFFVLWGLLHLYAAKATHAFVQPMPSGGTRGRLMELVLIMLLAGLIAVVVGAWLNWKNSSIGYWINVTVLSVVDIGFVFGVLLPGYAPMIPGALGPLLWIVALVFSTVGCLQPSQRAPEL
jgi:hypothetical protein